MTNSYKIQTVIFFFSILTFFSSPISAIDFFSNDDEGEYVWQSGLNRYIKYVEQEKTQYGKNQHPVDLNQKDLKSALIAIEIPDDGLLSPADATKTVFTAQQIKLLSEELPKAFRNAKADQDIIFVLEKNESKLLGLKEQRYMTGRAFYTEDKLNIILGEYDFFRSKAFESAYDPGDQRAVPYNFIFGSRKKASKALNGLALVNISGIENKRLKKLRYDWLIIDITLAAQTYVNNQRNRQPETLQSRQLEQEAAKMAKQRREMRAEMARMRKEMQEGNNSGRASASAKSIEERIATLDQLRDKELITQEEYDSKRKEILNDI